MELHRRVEEHLMHVLCAALRREMAALPARDEVRWGDLEAAVQQVQRQVRRISLEEGGRAVGTGDAGPTRTCACGAKQATDHDATATWQAVLGESASTRAAYSARSTRNSGAHPTR